jgi:hypothetical protein
MYKSANLESYAPGPSDYVTRPTVESFLSRNAAARKDLGTKHRCIFCESNFYDLNLDPVCPKC